MSVPALFTKHRTLALAVAREYRVHGMDRDDVRQEALVALWEACRAYDRAKGPFPAFARLVVTSRLTDLLRAATREKRSAVTVSDVEVPAPEDADGQLRLFSVLEAMGTLSDRERDAVADHLNGVPATVSKSHDSALARARGKLRATA